MQSKRERKQEKRNGKKNGKLKKKIKHKRIDYQINAFFCVISLFTFSKRLNTLCLIIKF